MTKILFFLFFLLFQTSFSQTQWKLRQDIQSPADSFGVNSFPTVSIYGNYFIVGFPLTFLNPFVGLAYVFSYDGTSWNQQQTLNASDANSYNFFGYSISIYENFAIIGAYNSTIGNNLGQGAAYIFYFNGSLWIQQQKLISNDGAVGDYFGRSVSIYGNYAIVGAPFKSIGINSNQGAAYIFYFNGGSWIQQQQLLSNDNTQGDFSWSVSIYENYTFVSAPFVNVGNNGSQGAVYIFYFNGTTWVQQQKLNSSDGNSGFFGYSISIYENYSIIGAPVTTLGNSTNCASYIFYFNGSSWIQQQNLLASGGSGDGFGFSVSIYGNYSIISAPFSTIGSTPVAGAAYIYYFNGSSWIQQQQLISNNGITNGLFGYSVSIYGNYFIVGASNNDLQSMVYIYTDEAFQQTTFEQTTFDYSTTFLTSSSIVTTFNVSTNSNITMIEAIVGSVGGVCLLIILIVIILLIKKRKNKNKFEEKNEEISNTQDISKVELNQIVSENDSILNQELKINEEIGKGKFGKVYQGKLGFFLVACKKLRNEEAKEIEKEVEILKKLKHPNIVTFIGIKELNNETYMIMEYMNSGDLLSHIRKNESFLETKDLFSFAEQISCGMEYLEKNYIIHKDLAARNILCSIDGSEVLCKISDFGLSKILDSYYYEQSETAKNVPIPIKWSAPELIFKDKISTKCDVFSFGVVLFEIFSKGQNPWSGFNNKEVIIALEKKERMSFPEGFGPQFIINLINECWKDDPHARPTFKVN